jgi:predicted extracellular nuclease
MCGNGEFFCGGQATSFDNNGNQYFPSRVTISNSEGQDSLEKPLIAGTVTEATIVFDNLSTLAINFSQLDLGFVVDSERLRVKFNNVDF